MKMIIEIEVDSDGRLSGRVSSSVGPTDATYEMGTPKTVDLFVADLSAPLGRMIARGLELERCQEKPVEEQPKSPWAKPEAGQTKMVELSPEAFRKLSKFAAKRGYMVGKTPSDALEELFRVFRVEENS